ncbi:hypothetical protein [Williamsia deligens]|uniref:DUF5642 domain-containing protein n=1 Tax=Williamsia deligens TaxID=321325 RepID=A0ABW3G6Z0_9NOCA|nr:hypothetical protein [Williamsia deligens]MCP2192741.1 hypothetical protein [Williamsia deligens]
MKRVALSGIVAVSVLASAACSSGTTTSTTQGAAAGASASGNASSKPLTEYLLQQSDVPSGFQQQQLPPGAGDAVGSLTDATKGAKVSPSSCQPDLSKFDAQQALSTPKALFADNSTGAAIVNAVSTTASGANGSVDQFRRYNLGDCATHQITTTVGGNTVTATQKATTLDIDTPGVSGSVVVKTETVAQIPGSSTRTTGQYVALLPIPNGAVLVSVSNFMGQPDESVFRQVVTAAAKRISG